MSNINNSADVYQLVSESLRESIQEKVLLVTLNRANGVIGVHVMAIGSDTSVVMSTKMIARQALMDVACGVVLVHNHPSGNVRPSQADIEQTEKLHKALGVLEMQLIDHVIVSDGKWFSFAEEKEFDV